MCKGEQQVFAKCGHQRDIVIRHQCSKRDGTNNFCKFFKGDFKGKVKAVKSKAPKDLNILDIWSFAHANGKAKSHDATIEKFYDAQGGRWTGPGVFKLSSRAGSGTLLVPHPGKRLVMLGSAETKEISAAYEDEEETYSRK